MPKIASFIQCVIQLFLIDNLVYQIKIAATIIGNTIITKISTALKLIF